MCIRDRSNVPRTPGWMRALGLKPMSLGLDLRGGVYFMYEVDAQGAVKQLLTSMESDYRTMLRKERIPFTGVASDGVDTVRIGLRSGDDAQKVANLLRQQDPNLSIDTDTLGAGGSVTVRLSPTQIKQRQDFAIQQNITTLRNRVDELGVTEPIVARQGLDRIDQRSLPLDGTYTAPKNGSGVTVYLVDTGLDVGNAAFGGRASLGRNFTNRNTGDCADEMGVGHGTFVAGIVGGATTGVANAVTLVEVQAPRDAIPFDDEVVNRHM